MTPKSSVKCLTPEEFENFEKQVFMKHKDKIECPNCGKAALGSEGVGGNISQRGTRRLQLKCKGCLKKCRLQPALSCSGLDAAEVILKETYEAMPYASEHVRVEKKVKVQADPKSALDKKLDVCESDDEVILAEESPEVKDNEKDLVALLMKENQELKLTISQQKEELKEIKILLKKLLEGQNKTETSSHVEMSTPVAKKVGLDNLVQTLRSIKLGQQIKEKIPMRSFSEIVSGQKCQVSKESIPVESPNETDESRHNSKRKEKMPRFKKESQKTRKEKMEKLASMLIQPKKAPMEITKMHIKLSDVRVLKKAATASEARKILWALIIALGIRDHVLELSLIGLSVVELYVNAERKMMIEQVLAGKCIETLDNYNALDVPVYAKESNVEPRMVKRLSWLYARARTQKLKACMLEGLTENVCQQILAEAGKIQLEIKKKNEAVALATAKSQ